MKNIIVLVSLINICCTQPTINKTNYNSINENKYQKMENIKMKNLLDSISDCILKMNDFEEYRQDNSIESFRKDPATIEDIKKVEDRLQVELPSDYKEFLLISNGFHAFTTIDPTFHSTDKIDYLKNVDPELISLSEQFGADDIVNELERSIIVAGINEEQYFLLIPPINSNTEWEYWKFASWIPGEVRYNGLESYFIEVLNFMNNIENE